MATMIRALRLQRRGGRVEGFLLFSLAASIIVPAALVLIVSQGFLTMNDSTSSSRVLPQRFSADVIEM